MSESTKANWRLAAPSLRAVLFDLDGTLLDTDDQVVARVATALRPVLGRRARRFARAMVMKAESPGNYAITLLDWLGLDAAVVSAVSRVRAISGVRPSNEFRLIPGVQGMLRSLHARGYRLGIVTTRTRQVIVEFLECFPEIGEVIEVTCGLQDTRRLKPHPAPVRLAASRLGVRVDQCLMVGDTVPDIKSARRAGAWCVAVLCGFGERNELEKAGAHAILGSTVELDQLLADHAEGTSALRTDPPLK